jgi:hypothetical protein
MAVYLGGTPRHAGCRFADGKDRSGSGAVIPSQRFDYEPGRVNCRNADGEQVD